MKLFGWSLFEKDRDTYRCERLVKTNGTKIEIAGIDLGKFKLGKVGVEPTVIQAASQALMLLDAYQYDLCTSIGNIRDQETKDKYVNLMMENKLRAQSIIHTLAALSLDPQSKDLQATLRDLVISSEGTVSKAEKSEEVIKTLATGEPISDNALDVDGMKFEERIQKIQAGTDEVKRISEKPTVVEAELTSVYDIEGTEKMQDFAKEVYQLNEAYRNEVILKLGSPDIIWERLATLIQKYVDNPVVRKVLGSQNVGALNRYLANLAADIGAYRNDKQLGLQVRTADLERTIRLKVSEVLTFLNDLVLTLNVKP